MLNSQITLTLFFLYVVIVSDKFFDIISCRLQRLIIHSASVRHFFIFMNIFLFTFILGWYTEFSIFDAKESFNKEEFSGNDERTLKLDSISINVESGILVKYFSYSILIYLLFILTTKCELEYLIVFLVLILASFIIFILKTYGKKKSEIKTRLSFFEFISSETKDKQINEYLKLNSDKSFSDKQKEVSRIYTRYVLTNLENILFILSLIILVIGVLVYLIRKKTEYGKDFNYQTFILGSLKCKKNL
jgi:hypothetical protein